LQGKPKFSKKTCPSATFVHHKIPRAHPGLNPGSRGGKPATNRLSYGAAYSYPLNNERAPAFLLNSAANFVLIFRLPRLDNLPLTHSNICNSFNIENNQNDSRI
jgi:hypothetical protein